MRLILVICFPFVLQMSISFSCCLCIGSDTILTGQSLFPNQTIVSREGKFELGFFAPANSDNYYVGVWYRNIPVQTVVWVANRNCPISYSFYNNSRVELLNGTLYLFVNLKRTWILGASYATEAVILDTGNFVLRNASGIIWQSFDNPTDTWLPGGKVGFRWFSDIESKLVSWRNKNDPATGLFSLGMQTNRGSELFIMRNKLAKVWRSGVWQGGTFNSLLGDSNYSNFYNFSYVSRHEAVYLVYNIFNESVISRIMIDYVGRMIHFVWSEANQAWITLSEQPSNICALYAFCGRNAICDVNALPPCSCLAGFVPRAIQDWEMNDFSGGCVRQYPKNCLPENDFTRVASIRLPTNCGLLQVGRPAMCEFACTTNCLCNAYAHNAEGGCLLFMGNMLDLERLPNNSADVDLYVRMNTGRSKTGKRNVLPMALAVPVVAVILVCCVLCYFRQKLKSKVSQGAHQNLLLLDMDGSETTKNKRTSIRNSSGDEKDKNYELPVFSFSSIAAATNNFSITNKLGEGDFGLVYKGELLNKQFVAVKRLSRRSGQGLEEFITETHLTAKLQHRNLVGILGCCIENNEKIIVYEYMPNKSLDSFLFEPTKKELLDWKRRVHIIEGIAQGLLYLHHYSQLRIVHRDLKASNILLDVEMNPKISDFGMARIFGGNDSQANTNRIVGTYSYMSHEYAMEGLFSVKSDVFSFGVLMLEIISGKKNTGFYGSDYRSLLGYAWDMWKRNVALELIDPTLELPSSSSSIPLKYIQIGLLCVQENPRDRPMMSDVVTMLNNEQTTLASPKDPAFTFGRSLVEAIPGQSKVEVCSVNGLTVSKMEAR